MGHWRRWTLAAVCACAAAGVGVWAAVRGPAGPPPPHVNHAQAQAMLPAIEKYLDSPAGGNQGGGLLAATYPKLKSRTLCTATIIEIRPDGPRWRVGMETRCAEYARRRQTLLTGTAGGSDEVMILVRAAGSRYRVVSAVSDNWPVVPDTGWVDRHFSRGAAYEINYGTWPMPPDPVVQARRAFGFPPGTPAVTP